MSSCQAHRDETSPAFKSKAVSCPDHQILAATECTDKTGALDEASSDKNDDYFDVGDEFRDRFDAIKDGAETRYNPLIESLPRLPTYHPSFVKAERYCSELMEGATLVLKNAAYKDTRILQLLEKASNSTKLEYPKPRIVGLIGDSGVGKSSLINSLLDIPDLALSGASGEACTNVVTEYHKAQPSQNAPYMAEIELFEPASVQRTLRTHVFWYYRYLHRSSATTMDQEAIDELNAQAETACQTFQALFADRAEFSDQERTEGFFKQAQSSSDPELLQTLFDWIQESVSSVGAEGGIIRRSADAPEDLSSEVEPFIKTCKHLRNENGCPIPSLWPLIRQVRVFLHSPFLQRGLIIADLPGLSDSNKMRTGITTKYMRRCTFGILVAPIARVQTDNLVQKRLGELHRLYGPRKALLCSKIDDMPAKQKPSDLDASPHATEEHEQLMAAYQRVCSQKGHLTSLKRKAKGKEKQDLHQKIVDLDLNKKIYSALLREGLILMRNQKITTTMRQKYKTLTQDHAQLVVFGVSNTDYTKHTEGHDLYEELPVSIQTTGIPHLRYYLSKLPARSRLDALKHYCHGTVEDVIGSLWNWSQQSTTQRRVELQELVARPGAAVGNEIKKYIAELKSSLKNCILQEFENRQKTWVENSVHLFEKWTGEWHSATFAAWCRNVGAHNTKKQPFVSWNAEILKPVTNDLIPAWQLFDDRVLTARDNCLTALVELIDGIGGDLAAEEGISSEPMAPFLSSLTSKKTLLRKYLDDFSATVDEISRDVKLNVIMDDEDPDSFLLQSMIPIYNKCAEVGGKNLHTQRSILLKDAMVKGKPFASFRKKIRKSFETELDKEQPVLLKRVQRVFNMILEDFGSTIETPDPKRDALRSQIQQFVEDARSMINGPLATELATAMADSE